jgi:hypothetical protein
MGNNPSTLQQRQNNPVPRPMPASNCSQDGLQVAAFNDDASTHTGTSTPQQRELTQQAPAGPSAQHHPPKAPGPPTKTNNTTCPQPHKQLLVGWITGGVRMPMSTRADEEHRQHVRPWITARRQQEGARRLVGGGGDTCQVSTPLAP